MGKCTVTKYVWYVVIIVNVFEWNIAVLDSDKLAVAKHVIVILKTQILLALSNQHDPISKTKQNLHNELNQPRYYNQMLNLFRCAGRENRTKSALACTLSFRNNLFFPKGPHTCRYINYKHFCISLSQ